MRLDDEVTNREAFGGWGRYHGGKYTSLQCASLAYMCNKCGDRIGGVSTIDSLEKRTEAMCIFHRDICPTLRNLLDYLTIQAHGGQITGRLGFQWSHEITKPVLYLSKKTLRQRLAAVLCEAFRDRLNHDLADGVQWIRILEISRRCVRGVFPPRSAAITSAPEIDSVSTTPAWPVIAAV